MLAEYLSRMGIPSSSRPNLTRTQPSTLNAGTSRVLFESKVASRRERPAPKKKEKSGVLGTTCGGLDSLSGECVGECVRRVGVVLEFWFKNWELGFWHYLSRARRVRRTDEGRSSRV